MSIVAASAQSCAQPCALGASERWNRVRFPFGAILYYDANLDPYTEQTGGPHTFNHAVLSPQYQRSSDGSYSNVGAKPAVDVFGGQKWLRSCGAVTNLFNGDTSQERSVSLTNGTVYTLHVFGVGTVSCSYGTATVAAPLKITATATESVTFTPTGATHWMLTATAYPVPYVPPGVTQPASNATTTGGSWFSLPDGSPLWQALTGQPLTLATRVMMGVGSGDLVGDAIHTNILTPNTWSTFEYFDGHASDASQSIRNSGYDGTSYSSPVRGVWSRNERHIKIIQTNADGSQFRVGNKRIGIDSAIQWGSWMNYDGSFNPSSALYRLMLGYNSAQPMWFSRITAWKEQVSDARILEAMA